MKKVRIIRDGFFWYPEALHWLTGWWTVGVWGYEDYQEALLVLKSHGYTIPEELKEEPKV